MDIDTSKPKKTPRTYKNGTGPKCGSCHEVGHYRKKCPKLTAPVAG